jgi:anti-sigma factor RsiW
MGRDCSVVIEMKSARPVSDEDLNAYIDGELPADRRCEVKRLIATDDAVRVQVESLRRVRELVRLAFTLNKKE